MTADEILERLPGEVDIETSRKAAEAKETKKSDQLIHAQKGGKIGKLTPSHKHSEVKQKPAVEQEQQEADADDETQVKDIATEASDALEVSAEVNEPIPEITTKEPEEKSMSPLVEFAMKEVEAYNKTINAIKEELGKEGTLHSDFMEQYAHTFQKYIKFTSPNATLTDAIDKWLVHLQNQKRHCTDMVSAKKINFIHLGQMTAAGTFIIAFQEAQAKELGLSKHPNVYLTPSKYHEKREVPPDCKDTFLEGMFIESGEWDSKKELLTSVSDSISIAPELPLMKMNICIDLKPLSFPKNVIKVPVFPLPRKSWDFGRAPSPLCYAYLPSNVSQLRMVSLRSNLFPVFFGAVIISVFVCAEALSDGKHSGDGPYKVLIVLPFASKSHKNVLWPLAMGLAGRGHLVTIITPHKPYKQVKGITEITLDGIYSSLDNAAQNMWSEDGGPYGKVKLISGVMDAAVETCNKTLSHYAMEPFLEGARSGTAHFDLIVVSAFFNECWYPLAKIYQAPLVLVSTSGMFPWLSHSNGFRDVTSFMTSPFFDGSKTLSFPKRLANTLAYLLSRPIEQYYYWRRIDALLLEKFEKKGYLAPSPTPLEKQLNSADLTASASMTFTNTHVSTHDVRPLLPSVVEVGGMHCAHANALPKELEEWVSGSEDGFVLFSLGSAVNPSKIPPSRRKMFIDAFSKFPRLRFLWKWDSEQMDGLPPNVKLSTWLPQQDLLGHKRIKAFITHGGLLSTQEAIYHGVPLVGLPVGADQHMNMEHVLAAGTGVTLSWSSLSAEEIISALKTVMFEPRYKERLDLKSRQFKDQPQPPVERAVYWMEYVVRHNGAEHLQSTAKNLYWFQYYLIDVWAALLVAFLISMWVSKKTATFIFGWLFSGSESKSVASSKKQQKKREKSAKEKKSTKQE